MRTLLAVLLATPFFVSTAIGETVHFRSATWPPTPLQLKMQKRGQTIAELASAEVTGELYRPPQRDNRVPAVVLLHPCDGRLPQNLEAAEAARFTALGYAVLAVDSFGSRGIRTACWGVSIDVMMDAYGALQYLADQPFIDPRRVALAGYSYGANVTLAAVAFDGPERLFDQRFAAAVAYYPDCNQEAGTVSVPTLILAGEADEWTPARLCRGMMSRRPALGAELRLVVYPGAKHGFNLKLEPRSLYGYRLEYNAEADNAAWNQVTELLRDVFGR